MSGRSRRGLLVVVLLGASLVVVALNAGASELLAPGDLAIERAATRSFRLRWTDTNSGRAHYEVQESARDTAHFKIVGRTSLGAATFLRKRAPEDVTLFYRVRAYVAIDRKKQYSTFSKIVASDGSPPSSSSSMPASSSSTTTRSSTTSSSVPSSSTTTTTVNGTTANGWQLAIGSTGVGVPHALAVDPSSGATYVGGYVTGTVDFGGTRYTSSSVGDAFVAKYTRNGVSSWVRTLASTGR